MKLKCRILVYGNRDTDKDKILSGCTVAEMYVIRMVLSIGTCMGITFGSEDIKCAYKQRDAIPRVEVYFRPPRECNNKRRIARKLIKRPYGLVDTGRK